MVSTIVYIGYMRFKVKSTAKDKDDAEGTNQSPFLELRASGNIASAEHQE